MDLIKRATIAFAAFIWAALPADPAASEARKDVLAISAGAFDVSRDNTAAEARLENCFGHKYFDLISPHIGIMATSDGAFYAFVGLHADFKISKNFYLSPAWAVGAFHEGDGFDLGHTVEFRTTPEASYRFSGRMRVGLQFSHMSNADLGDNNPGTESLMLVLIVPLGGG